MVIKELSVQTSILKKLRAMKDAYWIKLHDVLTAGLPDIIGCYKGRFIAIEVKRPGEKPRPLQYRVLELITQAGGIALWTDSSKDVNKWIQQWENNQFG